MTETKTPTEEPRKPDWIGASLRQMDEEREELLRWLAEDGPLPEDLKDFLI